MFVSVSHLQQKTAWAGKVLQLQEERKSFAFSAWGLNTPPRGEEAKHFLSFLVIIFDVYSQKEEEANGLTQLIVCISIRLLEQEELIFFL